MKDQYRKAIVWICFILAALVMVNGAVAADEVEPNGSLETAGPLDPKEEMSGAIDPVGDVDYFALNGVNSTWGFIALLDTSGSSGSGTAVICALNNSGEVLQMDKGSWEHGSGIALQNYPDNNLTHYLRVNEDGDDQKIKPYTLRYYNTITQTQPEVEPNETLATGTPSGFSHAGLIDPPGDVDCFLFHGRPGDNILLALNGDPENDGSTADLVLELLDPLGAVIKSADIASAGGNEFIEYTGLASEGVYCYRVREKSGSGGPTATYKVGIVRNGGLYFPGYSQGATWLNEPPDGVLRSGQRLTIKLSVQNTSPIVIPGNIKLAASYNDECLSLVQTSPESTTSEGGYVSWDGQKTGLSPGEVYSVILTLRAKFACTDYVHQNTGLDYYFTGAGDTIDYSIKQGLNFPALQILMED
jgi:hypothetical protein